MAEDVVYVYTFGKQVNRAQFIDDSLNKELYTVMDFTDTAIRQFGDVAIATHKTIIKTDKDPKGEELMVTMVWSKQSRGWLLISRNAIVLRKL